jgi:tetratricopeptide (TPR) repeat protein
MPERTLNLKTVLGAITIHVVIFSVLVARVPAQSTPPELAAAAAEAMQTGDYGKAEELYSHLVKLMPEVAEAHSNLGLARYYQKKFAAAEPEFRTALRLKPDLFVPNFFLAEVYLKSEKYGDALPLLRRAVKIQPQEPAALRELADDLLALGRENEAVVEYTKLLQQDPKDETALYRIARIYLDLGQKAAHSLKESRYKAYAALVMAEFTGSRPGWETVAISEYRNAIVSSPQTPGLRLALADLFLKTSKWRECEEVLKDELKIDPQSYEARFKLAEVALLEGNLDSAIRDVDEAAVIRPEFFDPLPQFEVVQSAEQCSRYYAAIANSSADGFGKAFIAAELARMSSSAEASSSQSVAEKKRDVLTEPIKMRERDPPVTFQSYEQRRTLGLRYIAEKRFETGVRLLMPVKARWQSDPAVRVAVARALFKLQRFEELTQALNGGRPNEGESLYFLAAGYRQLGIRAMERLVEVNPQSPELQLFLGETFTSLKMFKEAKSQYETAITMHPNESRLYFGLGDVHYDMMQFEAAADAYGRAMQMDPSDPRAYIMCGNALVRLHRAAEAIPLGTEALKLNSKSSDAHIMLGRALEQLGQNRDAIGELEQAANADTDGSLHYILFNLYRKVGEKERSQQALLTANKLKERSQLTSAANAQLEGSLLGFQQ